MKTFNELINQFVSENEGASPSVIVKLQLNLDAVRKIEQMAEQDIKALLETEINNNVDTFIEMLGYDNW